jgi:serine/threonine protein kinase
MDLMDTDLSKPMFEGLNGEEDMIPEGDMKIYIS